MLSEKAFNAFLKTLEEPPPHAKFVFATTEIRKVPVTILSRCQRFDLRRVEADSSSPISAASAPPRASRPSRRRSPPSPARRRARCAMPCRCSTRPSRTGPGVVAARPVRDMLGLADRAQVIDLFEAVMRGDVPAAFAGLRAQYDAGADPGGRPVRPRDFTHIVTRLKLIPEAAKDRP